MIKFTKGTMVDKVYNELIAGGVVDNKFADNNNITNYRQIIAYLKTKAKMNIELVSEGSYKLNKNNTNTNEMSKDLESKLEEKTNEGDTTLPKTNREAILNHLEKYGKISTDEARDLYNCSNLPSVIYFLRSIGYNIINSKTKNKKVDGIKVDRKFSYTTYTLIKNKTEYSVKVTVYNLFGKEVGIFQEETFSSEQEAKDNAFARLKGIYHILNAQKSENERYLLEYESNRSLVLLKNTTKKNLFSKKVQSAVILRATIS